MPGVYRLYVLGAPLELGYTLDESWPILSTVDLGGASLILTVDDVDSYAWADQEMTLTTSASRRMVDAFGTTISSPDLTGKPFVVTVDGIRVYGGVFLYPQSAMGISYPVIYTGSVGGQLVLTIRPYHTVVVRYSSFPPSAKSRIELPTIRDCFSKAGKLSP